ncbi:MAG TPA: hypothetical protein VLV88_14150 [Terriglobales bacterium]|nr:hypothetical protein [Terriglobales bacterium]
MVMKTGEHWHCMNPDCRCAITVETGGEFDGANPICACGTQMKKDYKPPVFHYLDFLRPESGELVSGDRHEK